MLAKCISLYYEVDILVALFLASKCRGCVIFERGVVYSRLYCPKFSVEIPCVGVLCGQVNGLEILLCEGGDVELCARTSKHISVFAFDPLTLNSLYYFVHLFILPYHIYACIVCVCLTCV